MKKALCGSAQIGPIQSISSRSEWNIHPLPTRPGGGRGGSGHKLSLNIFEEAGLELLKGKRA